MKNQEIISETTFEKARKKILEIKEKNPETEIVFQNNDDELNRKVLEKLGEQIDILLINQKDRKDFQKQRNSGLNEVVAKIAKKNEIIVGINFDEIIENKGKTKSEIIARTKQNVKLCNKNKLKMKFIFQQEKNKRDVYDLNALGIVLGMTTEMWGDKKI